MSTTDGNDDEPAAVEVQSEDLEERIEHYLWVRTQLEKIDAKWEEERKEMVVAKNRLEGRIHAFLNEHNITGSVKTKAGTAYLSTRYTASLADPHAFMDYVVNTGQFDLLERRASVTAVKKYAEDNNGKLPAGCNISAHRSLKVTRSK